MPNDRNKFIFLGATLLIAFLVLGFFGVEVYRQALQGVPLGLLELAVGRVIRENTYNVVPLPGAVWQAVDIEAVVRSGSTNNPDLMQTNYGHVFVPQSPQTLAYDPDGNLTNDGRFAYTWDGENRMVSAEARAGPRP